MAARLAIKISDFIEKTPIKCVFINLSLSFICYFTQLLMNLLVITHVRRYIALVGGDP